MKSSERVVAVVTGGSRGVGRGIAEGLGEIGACVYLTGRDEAALAGSAAQVRELGGTAHAIRCDHTNDAETEASFEKIIAAEGRLDLLVNSAWGGYERMLEDGQFTWERPFWQQPPWRWDAMFDSGVRAAFACSRAAARSMVERRQGLIVNVSFWAAQKYMANVVYGAAKAATDRMTADMAHELRTFGVAVVSLYPGLVRTERVMESAEFLDLRNSESPRFVGRAVVSLLQDPELMARSGQVVVAAELARLRGFTDIDGSQPRPLTLAEA